MDNNSESPEQKREQGIISLQERIEQIDRELDKHPLNKDQQEARTAMHRKSIAINRDFSEMKFGPEEYLNELAKLTAEMEVFLESIQHV
ncbi:MAG: hypothetical protein HY336_02165 [Candidatus Doudnabacteria bacterium]|nr:hypothetical protein [Candidatus Doudnabacteria bacterium]